MRFPAKRIERLECTTRGQTGQNGRSVSAIGPVPARLVQGRTYGLSLGRRRNRWPSPLTMAPAAVMASITNPPSMAWPSTYFRPLMKTSRSARSAE